MRYKYSRYRRPADSGINERTLELQSNVKELEISDNFDFTVKKDETSRSARDVRHRKAERENIERYKLEKKPEKCPPITLDMFMKREQDPEEPGQVFPEYDQQWDPYYTRPFSSIFVSEPPSKCRRVPNVILPPKERKKFESDQKSLEEFLAVRQYEKLPKTIKRIKILSKWTIRCPRRATSKDVSNSKKDLFGYDEYFYMDLRKSVGEAMDRRRHSIIEKMVDLRYDYCYEKRAAYEERQQKRDEYVELKNKYKLAKSLVTVKKAAEVPSVIKPPEPSKQKKPSLPVPALPVRQKSRETSSETPKVTTKEQSKDKLKEKQKEAPEESKEKRKEGNTEKESSKQHVIKMVDIFDFPSTSSTRVEKRKESRTRSVDDEPARKKREISKDDPKSLKNLPVVEQGAGKTQETILENPKGTVEKEEENKLAEAEKLRKAEELRKSDEEIKRLREALEENERKRKEEEMLRRRKEEEKERLQKEILENELRKIAAEREKREKEEMERKKKKEDEERRQAQIKMKRDMEALELAEQIAAERNAQIQKKQREQEQIERLHENRLKREIIDNDYEKLSKISPAEPRTSTSNQQDVYFEDEYMEVEDDEDDEIQIISQNIVPYVDNSAMPEKGHFMPLQATEICLDGLPSDAEKAALYKSVGLDLYNMRSDVILMDFQFGECSSEGSGKDKLVEHYEKLANDLQEYLGVEFSPVKFRPVDNRVSSASNVVSNGVSSRKSTSLESMNRASPELTPVSRSGSEERELEAQRIDYTKIDLEQLRNTWEWPFDETAGVYWPVVIDESNPSMDSAEIDHIRQLMSCHSYSGALFATLGLTSPLGPKESIAEFEAAYNRSGSDENSESEWKRYKAKPGRFSNRVGYKTQYIEQDRDEASKLDQDNRNREMEMDDEYETQINRFREENNFEKACESSREMLHDHIRSNRIDMYSRFDESPYARNVHPGRRKDNHKMREWTRSGYRGLHCNVRDIALGDELNRLTEPYDNLIKQDVDYNTFEDWCFYPMLASIIQQINTQPHDVLEAGEYAVLKLRRDQYDKAVAEKNFTIEDVEELCQLMPIEQKFWTIIYDQLSTHFKFLPPVSELMKNPAMFEVVRSQFEKFLRLNRQNRPYCFEK